MHRALSPSCALHLPSWPAPPGGPALSRRFTPTLAHLLDQMCGLGTGLPHPKLPPFSTPYTRNNYQASLPRGRIICPHASRCPSSPTPTV
ncbi:hypothetical protein FKP32DRAFT_369686 [Trametes sanguinea]|nr:hypothetical protein FKP32DRAFT_369686 [Trametes sanguinea]